MYIATQESKIDDLKVHSTGIILIVLSSFICYHINVKLSIIYTHGQKSEKNL